MKGDFRIWSCCYDGPICTRTNELTDYPAACKNEKFPPRRAFEKLSADQQMERLLEEHQEYNRQRGTASTTPLPAPTPTSVIIAGENNNQDMRAAMGPKNQCQAAEEEEILQIQAMAGCSPTEIAGTPQGATTPVDSSAADIHRRMRVRPQLMLPGAPQPSACPSARPTTPSTIVEER